MGGQGREGKERPTAKMTDLPFERVQLKDLRRYPE